jgi:hypothetical protein
MKVHKEIGKSPLRVFSLCDVRTTKIGATILVSRFKREVTCKKCLKKMIRTQNENR